MAHYESLTIQVVIDYLTELASGLAERGDGAGAVYLRGACGLIQRRFPPRASEPSPSELLAAVAASLGDTWQPPEPGVEPTNGQVAASEAPRPWLPGDPEADVWVSMSDASRISGWSSTTLSFWSLHGTIPPEDQVEQSRDSRKRVRRWIRRAWIEAHIKPSHRRQAVA